MKNHIVVFFCFFNVEQIKQSFDSMQAEDVDYFIVENYSKYSEEIAQYFSTKRLVGYIQFEKNIKSNALNIFKTDYWDLLKEYEYITMTDGDLFFL